jgi:isopentenyl diphosphate isomerase/L-lactate dehydrogenase-like FMN-dependent dehydrogenase
MASVRRALNSSNVVNIGDLPRLAQRRLPKSVFDYLDGGAEAELTLDENCLVFRDVIFRCAPQEVRTHIERCNFRERR